MSEYVLEYEAAMYGMSVEEYKARLAEVMRDLRGLDRKEPNPPLWVK